MRKCLTKFSRNTEFGAIQKCANLLDLFKSFQSDQRSRRHPVQGSDAEEHNNDDDDGNKRKDDDADRPGHLCAGVGDVVSTQKKHEDGYR